MEGGGGSEPPSDLGDSILSEMCKDFLGIEQEASLAAGQAAIMGEPLLLPGTDAEPKAPGFPKQAPPHPGRSGVYRTMDDMGAAESEAAERARKRVLLQQAPYQRADQAAAFSRDGRQLEPGTAGPYAGFAPPLLGAHQPYGALGLGYPHYGHLGNGAMPGGPQNLASTSYSMTPAIPMGGPVPAGLPPVGLAIPAPGGAPAALGGSPVEQEGGLEEAVATAAAKGPDGAGKAPVSRPGQRKDMTKRRQRNREASKRYRDRARQRERHVRGLEEELGTLRQQLLDLSAVSGSFTAERGELVREAGMIREERELLEKKRDDMDRRMKLKRDEQRRRSVHLAEREAELLKLQQQLMAGAAGEDSGVTNTLGFQGPWHAPGLDNISGAQQENTSANSGVSQEGSRGTGGLKSSGSKKDKYPGLYTDTRLNGHSLMLREVVDMASASQPQYLRCYSDIQKEILILSYSGRGPRKMRFWTSPATISQ